MKYLLMIVGLVGIGTGLYGYIHDGELIDQTGRMLYFIMIVFGIIILLFAVNYKKYDLRE